MIFGNQKINTNPCDSTAEERANWSVIQNFITNLGDVLEGSVTSDHKVAVNATDHANNTANYLHSKVYDTGTYVASRCTMIRSETKDDLKERFYIAWEDVPEFTSEALFFVSDGGEPHWAAIDLGGSLDNYTVLVTGSDPTPKYLHDAFEHVVTGAYVNNADIQCGTRTITDAGEQTEQPFVDVSVVSGWHATEFRVLTISNNVTSYKSITEFSDTLFAGITLDGGSYDAGSNTLTFTGTTSGLAKIGKADAEIPARDSNIAGSGTVSIWEITGTALSDTGLNETWYNIANQVISDGVFLQAKQINGQMVIDFEDCDA